MADQQSITGKFLGAGNIRTVGQNGMQVRSFWLDITDKPEYPNTPEFQLKGDKVHLVDGLAKNQQLQVKYNLDGRRYTNPQTGREGIITNLNVWQINVIQLQSAAARPAPQPYQQPTSRPVQQVQPAAHQPFGNGDEENDLPF